MKLIIDVGEAASNLYTESDGNISDVVRSVLRRGREKEDCDF